MPNEHNLRPHFQSGDEAKEAGRAGGIKSGEAKRERKIIREALLKKLNAATLDEIIDGVIDRAKLTDSGFSTFRDSIGEKPQEEAPIAPVVIINDNIKRT